MRSSLLILSLLAASVLGAGGATAQQRPPPPDRPPTLAERLDLRSDQEAALRAYQDELAMERADASHGKVQADLLNGMTTPQRLDWMLAQLPGREADARRAAAATRAFYAALSPDQQRTFDRLTRMRAGAGPGPGPGLATPTAGSPLPTPPAQPGATPR